jgi:hypothetical protein
MTGQAWPSDELAQKKSGWRMQLHVCVEGFDLESVISNIFSAITLGTLGILVVLPVVGACRSCDQGEKGCLLLHC